MPLRQELRGCTTADPITLAVPAPVAQWIEQQVSTLSAEGSSPSGRTLVPVGDYSTES